MQSSIVSSNLSQSFVAALPVAPERPAAAASTVLGASPSAFAPSRGLRPPGIASQERLQASLSSVSVEMREAPVRCWANPLKS